MGPGTSVPLIPWVVGAGYQFTTCSIVNPALPTVGFCGDMVVRIFYHHASRRTRARLVIKQC